MDTIVKEFSATCVYHETQQQRDQSLGALESKRAEVFLETTMLAKKERWLRPREKSNEVAEIKTVRDLAMLRKGGIKAQLKRKVDR